MYANLKETTSLGLDGIMKCRSGKLLALQATALGEMPFAAGTPPGRRDEGQAASRKGLGAFSRQGALPA